MSPAHESQAQGSLKKGILITRPGEKARERLDRLEALAASAAQSHVIERTPATGTGSSEAVPTHDSPRIPTHKAAQSLPTYDASDVSDLSPSVASPGECQQLIPRSDDPPSVLSIWDSTKHGDPSILTHSKHNDGVGPYWTTTIDCGCSSPQVQIRTQSPDPFSYGEVSILSFGPSATGADPYANNLRIETVCTAAALYTLGAYVGITEDMFCAVKSLSPFFWSGADSADDADKAISTMQTIFKTLKPDLRPSSEQITVEHHPYIDASPFPTLRKNLITHQEEVDEDESFHDILTGLVCLGRCRHWEEGSRRLYWICFDRYAVGRPLLGGKGVVFEEVLELAGR